MPPDQRFVAGLWCGEVLERLPDLVEQTLAADELARVGAHVAGCDWCERFGGAYGGVVTALRAGLPTSPAGLAERLAARLHDLPDQD